MESNVATAYGTIVHELFQTCMLERDFSTEFMDQQLKGIISRNIEMLFFVMEPLDRVRKHVRERYPLIQNWASKHVAALQKNPGRKSNNDISIVEILETEERIWSPMYGLKGSLDMTIRAAGGSQGGVRTMPFEIKTGRKTAIANHRAQTILYTLMLSDRYDMPVIQGILYYLDFSEAISVPATQLEIGALIRGRNFVAHSGQKATVSAPLVSNTGRCNSCFSVKPCFLYYKAANGPAEPLEKTEYEKMTENVGEEEKKFLLHWDELLTMEEKSMGKFLNEMWLMSGVERQRVGRCFASLRVESKSSAVLDGSSRIEYTLCRAADVEAAVEDGSGSFLDSQINVGDQILVSDSLGHLALASGILNAVGPDWIAISVDREFDTRSRYGAAKTATEKITYRVEKDEFSNIMAMIRNNIIQLLMDPGCVAKKRLIVNLDAPRFVGQRPGSQATALRVSRGLNVDQKRAVKHVLAAEDYALIMGMPGTGKTTTIVRVIEAILAQKKSILLASYTHTAVDNILLKIKSSASSILRLGPVGKVSFVWY
ncbi:DNA replication factor Dna2-domain-containing protein [Myxozyma melibiosi]|uniref:DNA helicase n=1 Tax=Myxozyma melibiosi TaxID=54550 RepID=A0ABR1EZG9_9ASCO